MILPKISTFCLFLLLHELIKGIKKTRAIAINLRDLLNKYVLLVFILYFCKKNVLKVFTNINENIPKNSVVSIGFFDGVHKGHVYLLKQLINEANLKNQEELVITLWPHPAKYFGKSLSLLNSLDEKLKLIENLGIRNVLILDFNSELASLSADKFVEKILLNKLSCSYILMGYNNSIGNKTLVSKPESEFAIPVKRLDKFEFGDFNNINSSQIRECISKGNMERAKEMLGYNYKIDGKIISGYKIGRKLGFPTANLELSDYDKIQPANGVYIAKAHFDGNFFPAMFSKGMRPSFDGKELSLEFHIPNFQGDLYGKLVELEFFKKIRDEEKYENIEDLIAQIKKDQIETLDYFSKNL